MTNTTVHPTLAAIDTLESRVSAILGGAEMPKFGLSNICRNAAHIIALQSKCIETVDTEAYAYYTAALNLAAQRLVIEGHLTSVALVAYENTWGRVN